MWPRFRVKIKNPWPFSIGEIITLKPNRGGALGVRVQGFSLREKDFKEFPEIFQPLGWAEFRTPKELPKYVNSGDGEKVYFVKSWGSMNGKPIFKTVVAGRTITCSGLQTTTPSTKADFDKYMGKISNSNTSLKAAIKSTTLSAEKLAELLECSKPTLYKRFKDGLWKDSQAETLLRLKLSKIYTKP